MGMSQSTPLSRDDKLRQAEAKWLGKPFPKNADRTKMRAVEVDGKPGDLREDLQRERINVCLTNRIITKIDGFY